MIRSSHGTPPVPNPMARGSIREWGVSGVLLNESIEGEGGLPRDSRHVPCVFTGSQGLESLTRPPRFPGPGGMGGVGSPSNGMPEEEAGIPRNSRQTVIS